jgi:histidinol dehydrogenase
MRMLRRFVPRTRADWDEALSMRARFGTDPRVTGPVSTVIDDVRRRGDAAVEEAARRFDLVPFGREKFRVSDVEWDSLAAKCPRETVAALELAAARIEAFHRAHLPASTRVEQPGAVLEQRVVPLSAVLCYAPGGRASYPSTVLMTAIPARVAGVKRVCVTSPAKGADDLSPAIAAAARIAGAHELWRIGGVQAVAGFALGTGSIARVDKVVGPGNAFVTEAKRVLSSEVGIDSLAGPTEVLIVAEEGVADPRWLACDLVAQAEHDPEARAVLVTTSAALADAVEAALAKEAIGAVARQALEAHGSVVVADSMDAALAFADRYAPEHLELVVKDPRACLDRVPSAGAVFLGAYAPVPVGDYIAGPNHTLPTAGTARFSSGLSAADFVRRQSLIQFEPSRLREDVRALRALADAEGLPAHARAAEVRFE